VTYGANAPSGDIQRASARNYRPASSTAAPRPEVLNAMRVLHEMPPYAREREIDYGRYSHFSTEERELLRSVGR
jgi:hypothetical protein